MTFFNYIENVNTSTAEGMERVKNGIADSIEMLWDYCGVRVTVKIEGVKDERNKDN